MMPALSGLAMLLLVAATAALQTAAAPAGVSPELESLLRKLEAISGKSGTSRPERVRVSDAELNAYLNHPGSELALPPGVSDVAVSFKKNGLKARAWIDIAQLQGVPDSVSGFTGAFGLLGGDVPLEIEGRLKSDSGFASFELERVSLASVPVPIAKVEELVLSSTRSKRYPHGFDIHSPFRLPYEMQRVKLSRGKAQLEF